ncbi:MAG TPA: acyl carrier protein [Acetobacteraceae bacterium]
MTIRSIVMDNITQVAAEQHKHLAPLSDDLPLLDSGLDSLCLAVIVARLEDRLGVDPFGTADELAFPVTIGDFVALYESAAA